MLRIGGKCLLKRAQESIREKLVPGEISTLSHVDEFDGRFDGASAGWLRHGDNWSVGMLGEIVVTDGGRGATEDNLCFVLGGEDAGGT